MHELYELSPDKKVELSFRPPFMNLLQKLGNPHLNLPPIIHVAGTNGKGSTIAMLKTILEAAGYSVHVCTSPHLIRFNERIVLAGAPIEDAPLEALIDEIMTANAGNNLSFFEAKTAIAFTAFSREPADICLLEVGMGGRLDCTNVIEAPLATVISRISMDHAEFLGNSIEAIAAEKAGIIKPRRPCITSQQEPKAMAVLQEKTKEHACDLHEASAIQRTLRLSLTGEHQYENAALAVKTLEVISKDFPVQNTHITTGLQNAYWPARLQNLPAKTYGLNEHWELWLDGGHNEDAGRVLGAQAELWHDKPLHIILGMMKTKNPQAFLKSLLPQAASIHVVNIEGEPASLPAQELSTLIPSAQSAQNYAAALQNITAKYTSGRILICGSLYLAGHVLQETVN